VDGTRLLVSPVLVGRDDLLDLADRRIAEVAGGRGQFLVLAGEAGVGKTRLLGALERKAAAAGFRTVRGGTYPSDLQVAAAVLLDLGRALERIDPFQATGHELAARLDDAERGGGDAHRRRRLLVLDVAELLARLAASGPVLVALEDLHWSDDLTLEILETLARRIRDLPLLLVATYRSDELFPRVPVREWRSRLLAARQAEELRLARLSAVDTATMTTLLLGTGLPAPRDFVAAVHARTDGVPLYVEELLALVAASGGDGAGDVRQADVPMTVEDAIIARLEPRSDRAKQIARAGAVIGRAFDLDLLASVLDLDPTDLSDPLDELASHFVLLPTRTPGRLGFRHALICDAIYERLAEPERRRLHAKTADAAARRPEVGTDAFLALHEERAGRPDRAFAAACRGAAAATAISSHGEARALYECALRTAPAGLPPVERGRLLEALATSRAATDDNVGAAEAYEAARRSYLEGGERLAAAAIAGPLVATRHLLGDGLEARSDALRAALGQIGTAPGLHGPSADPEADRVRARLLAGLAAAYMLDRRLDESIAYATDARGLAASVADQTTEHNAAVTLGACLVFAGRMEEGWRLLETAIEEARDARHEAEAARAYRMLGSSASVVLAYERAERWLREGIDYAERVELWNHRHYMAAHLGHVLWATGRWDEAGTVARHALADGRGGMTTRIVALHVLGDLALGRGGLDDAASLFGEAAALGRRMNELQRLSPALWGLAEVALARGRAADAIALSEEAALASEAVHDSAYLFPFAVTGTRALLAGADPQAARRWLARVEAGIEARAIPGTPVALDHARGLLALADGATGQARRLLEAAAEGWKGLGRVWEGTWALVDLGRANLRSNRRTEAGRAAAQAAAIAAELGAPALAAAAAEVAKAARRGVDAEPWAPLTAREFEVARLIAEGHTNAELAGQLGITRKTAAAHVEHILAKLGVGRRAEIATWTASIAVLHSRPHGGDREE
jgi:DNA-binding CsgD family transcriptional regulator